MAGLDGVGWVAPSIQILTELLVAIQTIKIAVSAVGNVNKKG